MNFQNPIARKRCRPIARQSRPAASSEQHRRRSSAGRAFRSSLTVIAMCTAGTAVADALPTASVVLDNSHQAGGAIPDRFMGVSVEWTLIERYMNPNAQPAFVNLLRNWGTGYIRVGGGSQDTTPYSADAPNTDSIITNADFALLRSTMDILDAGTPSTAVPPWGVVLGSAMTPSSSPANTKSFLQGVSTVFAGAERSVAGISLGNEPDQDGYGTTFPSPVPHRLRDVLRPGGERQLATRGAQYEHRHRSMGRRSRTKPIPPAGSGAGHRSSTPLRPRSRRVPGCSVPG